MSNELPGQCEEFPPEPEATESQSSITMLSPHFSLHEMVRSETATRFRIDNTPTKEAIINLTFLCNALLEPLRQSVGHPIVVNSGYRCPELNIRVRGAKNSQHLVGEAADIECPAIGNYALFEHIRKSGFVYDQCLYEYGDPKDWSKGWIHISIRKDNNRKMMGIVK